MWKKMRFDELFKVGSAKRVLKSQWKEEGVPFYRGREVTKLSMNGSVNNQLFITKSHFEKLKEKHGVPNVGDIIMTAIGTIGNAYIVKNNDEFYFKDASVLWLNKTSNILSKYVDYFIKSDLFKSQLDSGNGATVDTLTIKKLASIEIEVPQLQEQQLIVAKLDAAFAEINKAIDLVNKKENEFIKLNSSLLNNEFFEGKYTLVNHKILPLEKCLKKIPSISKIEKKNYLQTGNFPIISQDASLISGYSNNSAIVYDLQKPVIVFGDHTRVLKYIDFSFIRGADGTKILLPVDSLESKYLYYLLKYKMPKGVGYARHYSLLKKLQIVIPPLEEQSRVITKLDKCYSEMKIFLEYLKKNKYNYFKLKSAILSKTLQIKTA